MKELLITPFCNPASGAAKVPGSKSISNRALILAYLSDGGVTLHNLLRSQDTNALRTAFAALGVDVEEHRDGGIHLSGCAGRPPNRSADLYVANAGTVARFLPAALSLLADGNFRFTGSEAMMKRPMAGLLDCLTALGSSIEFRGEDGFFPFDLHCRGWETEELTVDASRSSQILSGLLMAATRAPRPMNLRLTGDTVSKPFVRMTTEMIAQFGGNIRQDLPHSYRVSPGLPGPAGGSYSVEPDASAASYFFALPLATGGTCSVGTFPKRSLQGDLAFLGVLESMGLRVEPTDSQIRVSAPSALRPPDVDFNAFSDTFLTLAALAPLLPGTTRIRGIAHTRHQETDRIRAMANELRKLGQGIEETEGSLTIHPDREKMIALTRSEPVAVETYDDHRVAMSFGILGCHDLHGDGRPWLRILDPDCCAKTFPDFFEELARMRSVAKARHE